VSWYQQDGGKNFALWPTYTWKFWLETRRLNPSDFRLLGNKQKLQAKSQAA
jgi:cyclohexanone monooxygenase